jgi:hypothetical protein
VLSVHLTLRPGNQPPGLHNDLVAALNVVSTDLAIVQMEQVEKRTALKNCTPLTSTQVHIHLSNAA